MEIITALYTGKIIRLAPIDFEKDPEIMARWTHDPAYMRGISRAPLRPLSAAGIRKRLEKMEKKIDENRRMYYTTIRSLKDDRLLGFSQLSQIEFQHHTGVASLGIGDPADRRKGYGSDALRLLLQLAFQELNFFRVSAWTDEYNTAARELFHKLGFKEEVRRRQAVYIEGSFCDVIHLGILREEWEKEK